MSSTDKKKPGIEGLAELGRKALERQERRERVAKKELERQARDSQKDSRDLGILDVRRYLEAHGRKIVKEKEVGGATLYCLETCIFSSHHTSNESAIVQQEDGKLLYQCFHDHCIGKTWKEARQIISGEKPILEYYSGYDLTLDKKQGKGKAPAKSYLTVNEKGRIKFNPSIMADEVVKHFDPVVHEGVAFGSAMYRYDQVGVWNILPEDEVKQYIEQELGNHSKTPWINDTFNLFSLKSYSPPEKIKPDPYLINLQNGMLRIPTMELLEHDQKYHSRNQLPITYNEDATCPLWEKTLGEIFADDKERIPTLQQFFGYTFFPKIIFPGVLFCIGGGANGKTLVQRILMALVGEDNITHIGLSQMEQPYAIGELKDCLLNAVSESSLRPHDTAKFKAAASGDRLQSQQKFKSDLKFYPFAKFYIAMNSFPTVSDSTDAFFRRLTILEFNQQFEGESDNKDLFDELLEEIDGIFLWALKGLKKTLELKRFEVSETVEQAKKRFRMRTNPVLTFVEEICTVASECYVSKPELYTQYKLWCENSGLKKMLSKPGFYERILSDFKMVKIARRGSKDCFQGIGFQADDEIPF